MNFNKEKIKENLNQCKNNIKEKCQKHPVITFVVCAGAIGVIGYKMKGIIDSKRMLQMGNKISELKELCRIKDAYQLETLLECAEEGSSSAVLKLYEFADDYKYLVY
jgi:hypothetical protein